MVLASVLVGVGVGENIGTSVGACVGAGVCAGGGAGVGAGRRSWGVGAGESERDTHGQSRGIHSCKKIEN